MAGLLAPMNPARKHLIAGTGTGRHGIQAAVPLPPQRCLPAAARPDLPRRQLALSAGTRVARLAALVVPAGEGPPTPRAAREDAVSDPVQLPLEGHVTAEEDVGALLAEAGGGDGDAAGGAAAGVAGTAAAVAAAGEGAVAALAAGEGGGAVGAAAGEGGLAAGAGAAGGEGLAGGAGARVALEDAHVGAAEAGVVGVAGAVEGLAAGFAAGVGR